MRNFRPIASGDSGDRRGAYHCGAKASYPILASSMEDQAMKEEAAPTADDGRCILEAPLYLAGQLAGLGLPADHYYLTVCARRIARPSDQERTFRASRVSGERSIEVALAEIQIISHNVYVQRKERTLPEVSGCSRCGFHPSGLRWRLRLSECTFRSCVLLEDIKAGSFVAEYMGEIVTEQEYFMRRLLYHNEKHRYMMVLSGGEVIDATRMGGWARFINHSCDPNCGVEKWDVNSEERCGIFALRDIAAGEELTFDYKFESFSKAEITECLCNAPNCRKVIGMNNRVTKSNSHKKGAPAVVPVDEEPKLLDPIVGRIARPVQGAKVGTQRAHGLMVAQRLLSHSEMRVLRRSHVMLERNLSWHMDDNFDHLALLPYFVSKTSSSTQLKHVPERFKLRELPNFPRRPRLLPRAARVARLKEIAESLGAQQQQDTNYLADESPPTSAPTHQSCHWPLPPPSASSKQQGKQSAPVRPPRSKVRRPPCGWSPLACLSPSRRDCVETKSNELMTMAECDREPSPDQAPVGYGEKPLLGGVCDPDSGCQCQPSPAEAREFRKVRKQ
ncbi:hypothetical protein BBJ28_00021167 [Nothophytophthora sp. Chile5]|nr:hypothetical protein BBJ28_00021167 [Nothophytophthora sp. Chile5]